MASVPVLKNTDARRLFLHCHGLSGNPSGTGEGDDLLGVFQQLGFVQLDSIKTVERAHHMILHARRQAYRPNNLDRLLEVDHSLFEHWTHDASIIPAEFFPHWRLRFARNIDRLLERRKKDRRAGFEDQLEPVLQQIHNNGPVCSADVGIGEKRGSGGWWDWHPSKTALEFLWQTGQISVTRRVAFRKFYDLTERVLPLEYLESAPESQQTIDWACGSALDRLGFATTREIAAFWAMVKPAEAKLWCDAALKTDQIVEVDITCDDGTLRRSFARPDVLQAAQSANAAPGIVRILSPFDPTLRDRQRAERLFGFDYRIEVFVPAAKRKYGYYVFPVLEGDSLIGRIDMKCDRKTDTLHVTGFWPENRVTIGKGRLVRLETAINRTRRFAGVKHLTFASNWLRF
ncbi:MAG: winged helix-turn-helix domain-containing protein [Paracoccaceae bacterium]